MWVQVPIERRFVRHRRMLTKRRPNVQKIVWGRAAEAARPLANALRGVIDHGLLSSEPGPIGDAVRRQNLMAVWYWNGELANFKALEEVVL
jgi:hypothetical protein